MLINAFSTAQYLSVGFLLINAAFGCPPTLAQNAPKAPTEWKITPLETHALPEKLLSAKDIRALSHSEILVSASFAGIFRWDFSKSSSPKLLARRGNGARDLWVAESVAASDQSFIASSYLFSYGWGWLESDSQALEELYAIELVADLDIHGDQVLLLGAQRGENGIFAPDGDIAWLGTPSVPPERMRTLLYSKDGPRADSAGRCGLMAVGAARFLKDGSFMLVPGVEEGVFHFDAEGQILRTWTSAAFGFDADCPLTDQDKYRLAGDERGRWRWVNGRRMVDEILPLPDGKPGLVIREVVDGKVRWTLKVPKAQGEVDSVEIPISSPSELAHLKGDVVDDRVYFLLWTYGLPPDGPDQPPRLVVMKITGKE